MFTSQFAESKRSVRPFPFSKHPVWRFKPEYSLVLIPFTNLRFWIHSRSDNDCLFFGRTDIFRRHSLLQITEQEAEKGAKLSAFAIAASNWTAGSDMFLPALEFIIYCFGDLVGSLAMSDALSCARDKYICFDCFPLIKPTALKIKIRWFLLHLQALRLTKHNLSGFSSSAILKDEPFFAVYSRGFERTAG